LKVARLFLVDRASLCETRFAEAPCFSGLSLTLTLTHSLFHTHSLFLSLSHSLSFTHTLSLTRTLSLSHTHTLALSLTFSRSPSHTLSLSITHTKSLAHTHTNSLSRTHTPSLSSECGTNKTIQSLIFASGQSLYDAFVSLTLFSWKSYELAALCLCT